MNEEQILKKQIKELLDSHLRHRNNTKIINAVTKFVIADREKQDLNIID